MSELPPAQAILENYQLQDSEAHNRRLANILQNVRDIIIVTDLDGTITYWNDGASAIHGYSETEMVGHSVAALYADEALLNDYLQHVRNGLEQRLEWQAQRKDGTSIWLDTRVTPMRDADGGLIGALQVGKDISGRKQAEVPLSYSEDWLDAIFEQSPLSMQVFMPDGAFVRANRAWEKLWGAPRVVMNGMNILADDLGLEAQGQMPYVRRAFAGELVEVPPNYYDPAAIGQTGTPRWTKARLYPIKDASGQIREVVFTHEDVTESVLATAAVQRSEEHFKALIQNSADVIQLVNREGLIAYVSPSVTRVLGFAPSETQPMSFNW